MTAEFPEAGELAEPYRPHQPKATSAEDALESLRNLALRGEHPDAVNPLVDAVRGAGLPHPGPPVVLVVTLDADGHSEVRYTTDAGYAVACLRRIASSIESGDLI